MTERIYVYTDGACKQVKNSGRGPGGWSVVVLFGPNDLREFAGGEPDTTNNRMELEAAVQGLKYLNESHSGRVTLYSDSAYLCNCFAQQWHKKWATNGWKTAAGRPVENRDLWDRLLPLVERLKPVIIKVKGHADNKFNNRCDKLAVAAARSAAVKDRNKP